MEKHSPKDRPVVEAALESGEVISDIFLRGDVFAEIPVIGTAIKICKAADSVRDRIFAIKLSKFILNLEDLTEKQKSKLKEKMNSGTAEAQKIGETLLFVLEHTTDLDKPSLLARILVAYVDGDISGEELRRLCQSVDVAFADDLQQFLTAAEIPIKSNEQWMRYLVASGLTRLEGAVLIGEMGSLYCVITPLGQKLRDICLRSN